MGRHGVGDEGDVDARLGQLEGGEPGPLEHGAGFIGEHLEGSALSLHVVHRCGGRAPSSDGQGAGVAVGEDAGAVGNHGSAVGAEGCAHALVLRLEPSGRFREERAPRRAA